MLGMEWRETWPLRCGLGGSKVCAFCLFLLGEVGTAGVVLCLGMGGGSGDGDDGEP